MANISKHDILMNSLDTIDTKINFIFGYLSNNHLATEALNGLKTLVEKLENGVSDEEKQSIQEYLTILEKNHKEHIKNVHDGIEYFMKLYGEQANQSVYEKMKEATANEKTKDEERSPEPMASVEISGNRSSEEIPTAN